VSIKLYTAVFALNVLLNWRIIIKKTSRGEEARKRYGELLVDARKGVGMMLSGLDRPRKVYMTLLPYLAFLLSLPLLSFAQDLHRGDFFPGFELKDGLSKKDYDYLKLSAGSIFGKARTNLTDINVDLLFVEFLNKYCIVCQQDAPEFAKFSQEIEADQGLRGKVKVLGVAVGNNTKEVENFKNEYSIGFPVIPDPESSVDRKSVV
jgi:thiol-disulfide isomerase/thioredoxin